MTTKINVVDYKQIDKGALKARFNIHVPSWHLMIRDCTLMESNGKRWIGFPSRMYEQDGQKKYFSFIVIEKEVKDAFDRAVLDAIKALAPPAPQPSAFEQEPSSLDVLAEDCPF